MYTFVYIKVKIDERTEGVKYDVNNFWINFILCFYIYCNLPEPEIMGLSSGLRFFKIEGSSCDLLLIVGLTFCLGDTICASDDFIKPSRFSVILDDAFVVVCSSYGITSGLALDVIHFEAKIVTPIFCICFSVS